MQLYLNKDSLPIYKALASSTRLSILNIIADKPQTISELAATLGISKAMVSKHVSILEDTDLIKAAAVENDNRKRIYHLQVDSAEINFPKKLFLPFRKYCTDIKLGYYSDFFAAPTCGLSSVIRPIGAFDDPRAFVSEKRIEASLLWLSDGYVEYKIPNNLGPMQIPAMVDLSMELSSEFPSSNNNWPSDITFTINGIEVGTWTCPGNYSDVRGKLTPSWWDDSWSQYGLLKHIRVYQVNTGIDGDKLSNVKLSDLRITESPFITIRIGIAPEAQNKGGLTIFGDGFGNHKQNIVFTLYYTDTE